MIKVILCWAAFCFVTLCVQAIDLADALDAPALTWTSGGQSPWTAQHGGISHDGSDAAESGTLTDAAESWLQTQLTGPGVLSFFWKVSSEAESDFLHFYIDGELQDGSISGEIDWVQRVFVLPSGTHILRWRYSKDLTGSGILDAAWVDQVSFVPAIDLAESLDIPWALVSGGGQVPWIGQTNVTHDGGDAAQSGPIGHSQLSWMEVTARGPLTLTFWWKVSSEANFDYLEFHVGNILKKKISGEVDWTQETFSIPAGPQTLRWQYNKDISASGGQDRGWVDAPNLPEPVILTGTLQPDRAFLLKITGIKLGVSYQLESSSNLVQWQALSRFTGVVSQTFIQDASAAALAPKRFYRVTSP